jgi:transposase
MGYRRMTVELLYQMYVRLKAGDSRRVIAVALGLDKKTVSHYEQRIAKLSFPAETDYVATLAVLATILPANRKPQPAFDVLQGYAQEIKNLIVGDKEAHRDGMKAKTAWDVVSRRHELAGKTSYETFKRFVRECPVLCPHPSAVARIEVNPGEEAQVDYGKMGIRQVGDLRKTVYAFSGILCASRLPFIQFCTSQNQISFAVLIVKMFSFWGGVTARINLDNLKAGVLSADIYDPTINRTIAELCEYYGTLADPARVRAPKDKGKVERSIPLSRELYKRLCALANDESLDELNAQALRWCTDEYGRKKHGTTGIPPMEAFLQVEKPCLRPLPAEPFVPASWATAKVHPDQFIQVHMKYYGLPAMYIGRTVEVRITETLVSIYSKHHVVRQYPVSKKRREYLSEDFPAWAQPFVPNSFASFLADKADMLHPAAGRYIRAIIVDQGNLGLRRAQGCLTILEKSKHHPDFAGIMEHAIAYHIFIPARLRAMFEVPKTGQNLLPFPISDLGKAMARSATYYTDP